METNVYKITFKKTKKSRSNEKFYGTFSEALSEIAKFREKFYYSISLDELVVVREKSLVKYSLESIHQNNLNTLGITDVLVDEPVVISAFRKMSKVHHPDHGGNSEDFGRIISAKDELLKYIEQHGPISLEEQ